MIDGPARARHARGMRYCLRVVVPGTRNLDSEADRLPGYAGEFTESERADVIANLSTLAPEVETVRDLYNATASDSDVTRATVEVFPLYDSQDAIVDMITHMPDSSLVLVPVSAIDAAPLTDAQKKTAYERLARIEIATLPPEIQGVLPDVVGG